jgi:hypothetical protein
VGQGVDINPQLLQKPTQNAETAGVDNRVLFLQEDIFETDFSMATVVTIYMSQQVNRDLRPEFFRRLKPGTRVVSHIFDMGDWEPDLQTRINRHNIYAWTIPADASGAARRPTPTPRAPSPRTGPARPLRRGRGRNAPGPEARACAHPV